METLINVIMENKFLAFSNFARANYKHFHKIISYANKFTLIFLLKLLFRILIISHSLCTQRKKDTWEGKGKISFKSELFLRVNFDPSSKHPPRKAPLYRPLSPIFPSEAKSTQPLASPLSFQSSLVILFL